MALHRILCDLKGRIDGLGRWAARGLAFGLGFLAAFSMPPLYQIYVLIPALGGLLWLLVEATSKWRAFVLGWWFGAGFFSAGLYWVSFALLVDAAKFAWLIPVATLGFAFGFGLYVAFTGFLVRALPGNNLLAKALTLASVWTFFEWVRGWLFTGFPWNPLGTAWAFSDNLMQSASIFGVFGLSLLAALVAVLPATLVKLNRLSLGLNLGVIVLLAISWGWGGARLSQASGETVPGVRLRLVQPNIAQSEKWDPALRERHMMDQLLLSTRPAKNNGVKPTHIIWAETAAPFFIARHQQWLNFVGSMVPKNGLIILGAPHVVGQKLPGSNLQVTNSLLAINHQGHVTAQYDKFHLVPFGEYMPLKDWLPLDRITQGAGSFLAGAGPTTLMLKGLPPVSPLICYEVIFPAQVTDHQGKAEWLLNLTNDAWYGKTAGPYQHFVNTQFRAVEQGVPVVRVAGTGMSGIIDPFGRVVRKLKLGEKNFIDGNLPVPVKNKTVFSRSGNKLVLFLTMVLAFFAFGLSFWDKKRA